MSPTTAKRERAEQILGELSELGLMLARDLAVAARAAETPEEKVAMVEAFQKTSRAVRLTLALDFKLQRDAARDAREDANDAAAEAAAMQATENRDESAPAPTPEQRQKTRVRKVLDRLLWTEAEADYDDYEILVEDLNVRLDLAAEAPGFADLPLDVLAQRLKADMQLSGDLIVTTAEAFTPANSPQPPLADTG